MVDGGDNAIVMSTMSSNEHGDAVDPINLIIDKLTA